MIIKRAALGRAKILDDTSTFWTTQQTGKSEKSPENQAVKAASRAESDRFRAEEQRWIDGHPSLFSF
jgi:hypothetical protein